ncbi:MAG TPA: hypothetical protein VHG91_13495 [Longimicrobium sp.]|nr:hypothetical protein [Longimicrobium sp.]
MTIRPALPLLALFLAACPTAGMHVPALGFTVAAAPAEVRPGDTLRLTATLENESAAPVTLEFGTACGVTFHVRAPDHRVVEPAETPRCEGPGERVELAPGASRVLEHGWPVPAGMAAGEYAAYFTVAEHDVVDGEKRAFKAGHRSNEVPFRVVR